MNTIRAIVFDCDGVILNSSADIANAVNASLDHYSMKKIPAEQLLPYTGAASRMLMLKAVSLSMQQNGLNSGDIPADEMNAILDWYLDYYSSHCLECTMLYPETGDLLSLLSEHGIHIAMVSNKPSDITRKILDYFGIIDFFDAIKGPEGLDHLLPAPDGIKAAVDAINQSELSMPGGAEFKKITSTEILAAGDSAEDIEAAKFFGAHSCGITGGYGDKTSLALSKPEITIGIAADLRSVLAL